MVGLPPGLKDHTELICLFKLGVSGPSPGSSGSSRCCCPPNVSPGVPVGWPSQHSPVGGSVLLCVPPVPSNQTLSPLGEAAACSTLKMGCTAGSWRYMAMPNTSDTRCVRSRWVMVWWTWKSLERTQILARSQSYFASEGKKMGFSAPGAWLSWYREERTHALIFQPDRSRRSAWPRGHSGGIQGSSTAALDPEHHEGGRAAPVYFSPDTFSPPVTLGHLLGLSALIRVQHSTPRATVASNQQAGVRAQQEVGAGAQAGAQAQAGSPQVWLALLPGTVPSSALPLNAAVPAGLGPRSQGSALVLRCPRGRHP